MASSSSKLPVPYYHYTTSLLQGPGLLSAKPRAQPARCLRGLVLDNGIELVRGRVDLLASLVELALGFGLGLLVLPPRLGAHGIELLLGFPGFGLGLVGLLLSVHREGISRLVDVRIAERSRALPRNPLRRPSLLPCPGRGSRPSSSVWQSRHRLSPVSRCPW
jgi:hypothetical protein